MRFSWCVLLATLTVSNAAWSVTERKVLAPRVTFGEVVPGAPQALADIDIGPAPPAGGSRLVSRDELRRALKGAGARANGVSLPRVVRIVTQAKRWKPNELNQRLLPRVRRLLKTGVTLRKVSVRTAQLLPVGAQIAFVRLPKLPRRVGSVKTTATVDFTLEGTVVKRLPVFVHVTISEAGAAPALARGGRVQLVIQRGAARVTALGVAVTDTDTGEVAQFRVTSTRKLVSARLLADGTARIVGGR